MKFIKSAVASALLLLSAMPVQGGAPIELYKVQAGETLSHIAETIKGRNPGSRIYGRQGILAQLLQLNSHISNPNLILVKQEIRVASPLVASVVGEKIPAETNERAGPSRTPAASVPMEPTGDEAEKVPFGGRLGLTYQFTELYALDKATGASADLRSKNDVKATVAMEQDWGDGLGTFFAFGLRRVDFEAPTNATKTLRMESKSLAEISAGASHRLSDKIALKYSLTYGKQLFLRGMSSNLLSIDAVALPRADAGLSYDLYRRGQTTLVIEGGGAYFGGAKTDTYDVNSGYGYGAALGLDRRSGDKTLSFRAGYRRREQGNTFVKLRESNVFGAALLTLPLFGGK